MNVVTFKASWFFCLFLSVLVSGEGGEKFVITALQMLLHCCFSMKLWLIKEISFTSHRYWWPYINISCLKCFVYHFSCLIVHIRCSLCYGRWELFFRMWDETLFNLISNCYAVSFLYVQQRNRRRALQLPNNALESCWRSRRWFSDAAGS